MREKFRTGEVRAVSIEGIFEHLERTPKEQLQSAVLMESFAEFNLSKDILFKDVEDLTEDEAKELLKTIHSLLMPEVELEEPSVDSSYPGEASGSISPQIL